MCEQRLGVGVTTRPGRCQKAWTGAEYKQMGKWLMAQNGITQHERTWQAAQRTPHTLTRTTARVGVSLHSAAWHATAPHTYAAHTTAQHGMPRHSAAPPALPFQRCPFRNSQSPGSACCACCSAAAATSLWRLSRSHLRRTCLPAPARAASGPQAPSTVQPAAADHTRCDAGRGHAAGGPCRSCR
jgi:hypothetical protein